MCPTSCFRDLTWPEITVCDGITPEGYADLAGREAPGGFDDVIVLDPTPAVLDGLTPALAAGATVNLVGERPLGRPVQVDVGRVHYDYVIYLGTRGPDIGAAYGPARNRAELRPGGVAWIVGGGGPMGRMHLQRMLEMPGRPARSSSPKPTCCAPRNWRTASRRWPAPMGSSYSSSTPS